MSFVTRRALSTLIPPKVCPLPGHVLSSKLSANSDIGGISNCKFVIHESLSIESPPILFHYREITRGTTQTGGIYLIELGNRCRSRCSTYATRSQLLREASSRLGTSSQAQRTPRQIPSSVLREEPFWSTYVSLMIFWSGK
jgi:hypothetical protein